MISTNLYINSSNDNANSTTNALTYKNAIDVWKSKNYYIINSFLCPFYNKCNNVYNSNIETIYLPNKKEVDTKTVVDTLFKYTQPTSFDLNLVGYRYEPFHLKIKGKSFNRPTFCSLYKKRNDIVECEFSGYATSIFPSIEKDVYKINISQNVPFLETETELILAPNTYWKYTQKNEYTIYPYNPNAKMYQDFFTPPYNTK